MPSYQYLRDIKPEDIQPEKPPELTPKEKRKNWWHYHRVWVLAGVLALAVVGYSVFEMVTRVNPDLTVTAITPYALPAQLVAKLEDGLEAYMDDVNGDGRVVVRVATITLNTQDPAAAGEMALGEDPNVAMANQVKLSGDLQTGESMLFILEGKNADVYQNVYGVFSAADGGQAPEAMPAAELGLRFADTPGLLAMDMVLEDETGGSWDPHEELGDYLIGLRPYYGTALEGNADQLARWEYAKQVLQALAAG